MRPKLTMRKSRAVQVTAGGLMLAVPACAVALTAGQADAQSTIQANVTTGRIAYGADVTVTGSASTVGPGQALMLEFAPAGSSSWRALSAATVRADGRFRIAAPLRQSGFVRIIDAGGPSSARATPLPRPTGLGVIAPSASEPVSVAARFRVPARATGVLGGHRVDVRGKLLPGVDGRRVRLEGRAGGSWRTLATARTGAKGGFDLHYTPGGPERQWLRVRFSGDRLNTPSAAHAGRLTVYRQSVASWYDDGGSTACGFHAYFGVAAKGLPCGAKVTFAYGGRTLTAVVDDSGPYVGGREWDLNQNTAAALGFGGVDTLWSSH